MPRTPRVKCVMCKKNFDQVEVRMVGNGLLRIFVAVRVSKRILVKDYICQQCRFEYVQWERTMEGDFDDFGPCGKYNDEQLFNDAEDIVI